MHAGEMCTCHTSHAHSPHTSRDAPCGVCLGVWRVVFWASWCLVHHTTMTPFKRARRGEWAYACCRDAPCGVCLGVWRVVFWPSWCLVHHTTMTPFKRARRGEWAYAC